MKGFILKRQNLNYCDKGKKYQKGAILQGGFNSQDKDKSFMIDFIKRHTLVNNLCKKDLIAWMIK